MKLSSDAAVLRILHEGINNFESLLDFDKKSIQALPATCKGGIAAIAEDVPNGIAAEAAVSGANISSISVRRLITAVNAAKYYTSVGRVITTDKMHYTNRLSNFALEWDDYEAVKEQDDPEVPCVIDKDYDRKIIKWSPIFIDCLTRTFGSRGPLAYVLREDPTVPTEVDDPVDVDSYYGISGSLLEELTKRLPHTGPIYKNDNATVYMLIEKAVRGTSVESTVKTFARTKNGRGAYLALIANHAGDTKYRAIVKKRTNLLQNIKWNGRSYPLESHVSNHRSAVDDLKECGDHITVNIPDASQRVEYLIDSITCNDNTLQAAIGLIRANTNNWRTDFEAAASALIEVDPYQRSNRNTTARTANVSALDYSAGRGRTGVDLHWHPQKEFHKLTAEQKDELRVWMKSQEGSKAMKKSRDAASSNNRNGEDGNKTNEGDTKKNGGNWKKKMKKAIKSPNGLKAVMSVLAEEEATNQGLVAAMNSVTSTTSTSTASANANQGDQAQEVGALERAFPATTLKLSSILRNKKK